MIASLLTYAAALGLAAAIPGPGVAALVGQSMGNGLRAAFFLLGGIVLGDLVYLTVAIAGLAAVAQTFAGVFLIVKILGGGYLLYLAFKLWNSKANITNVVAQKERANLGSFLSGFSVTMGNPKTIVFYLALLPTVLDLQSINLAQWLMLAAVTVVVLFATLTPYIVLAARARSSMKKPDALTRLNRFASGIIGTTGMVMPWPSGCHSGKTSLNCGVRLRPWPRFIQSEISPQPHWNRKRDQAHFAALPHGRNPGFGGLAL